MLCGDYHAVFGSDRRHRCGVSHQTAECQGRRNQRPGQRFVLHESISFLF
ncbi:hypothetical protein [Pseudomonas fluorescens]|nr:hypothetical protein [Pseudomonas fluorescens]